MIGWENNQGAYFINKLQAEVNSASEAAESAEQKTSAIGKMTDLLTTAKDTLVKAVNEVFNKIGNLSTLNTSSRTNLVSAINEVRYTAVDADGTAHSALNKIVYLGYAMKDESLNFYVQGDTKLMLAMFGTSQGRTGCYMVNVSPNGSAVVVNVVAGADISVTSTTNTLTITNTTSTAERAIHMYALVFDGSIEEE